LAEGSSYVNMQAKRPLTVVPAETWEDGDADPWKIGDSRPYVASFSLNNGQIFGRSELLEMNLN